MKSNLQLLVEHFEYKWSNDNMDVLYYLYPGMYSHHLKHHIVRHIPEMILNHMFID